MRLGIAILLSSMVVLSACPRKGGNSGTGGGAGGGTGGGGEDASVEFDAGTDAGQVTPDAGEPDAGPIELRINRLLPPRGASAGGTTVMIEGSGFLRGVASSGSQAKPLTTLKIGGNQVQDLQIIDDATIEMRTPPGTAGNVSVSLQNTNGGINCNNCFTYFDELSVTSFTPASGPLAGGNEVTITGTGFTEDTQVLFGTYSSPVITFVSATQLKAVAPRGVAAGPVDLVVYNKNGSSNQRRAYSYQSELRVTAIAPVTGTIAGATTVTLAGSGFTGATEVRFGSTPATGLVVNSDGSLTVTTPASTAGAVDVTVATPNGTWTTHNGFTFFDASGSFAVFAISPRLIKEGDVVTLTGQALDTAGLDVSIGGVSATTGASSFSTLQVTVPSRGAAARISNVSVSGTQSATLTNAATWRVQLTAATPNSGPSSGGTAVALSGSAIPPAVTLNIGALAATGVTVNSETNLALTTPAGSGGAASAIHIVDSADIENDAVLNDGFTFLEPLSIGRVQPDRGAIAGNTLVTVLGSGFGEGTRVKFGVNVARDFKFIDSHTVTCRTPKANAGVVDVRVERGAEFDTLTGGFAYFDPRSVSGGLSGGPMVGTLNITVLSQDQSDYSAPIPGATVMIGTDPSTPFQGVTDYRGQITFSDDTLVKAELVTVFKDFWQSASVTNVNAENLTVFLSRTGGGEPGSGGGGQGTPASMITGTVVGFKSPRPLQPTESLEARVFVAPTSLFATAPLSSGPRHTQEIWKATAEGGEYRVFTGAGLRAVYAILGIVNSVGGTFTPVSMGIKRGITASADNPATDQTVIIDTALDMTVPITIDSPLNCSTGACPNNAYAFLELGAEGYVPNPNNFNTAQESAFQSLITSTSPTFGFPNFPRLDGSNFIFMNVSTDPSTYYPASYYFRRQPGDLTQGATIGPMLPGPRIVQPNGTFTGTISWQSDPGPLPDLFNVEILRQTPLGNITVWSLVLPGTENHVTLPQVAVDKLLREETGNSLMTVIYSSRSPRFAYNQWTYDELSGLTWSSFTISVGGQFTP